MQCEDRSAPTGLAYCPLDRVLTYKNFIYLLNLQFGRYRFLRLPFGLKSAQDVFQKRINETFQDIPGIEIVAEDILIFSTTMEEHNVILRKLFDRARKYGVKFNLEKSSFEWMKFTSMHIISPEMV